MSAYLLDGKTAAITGGTTGIGRAISLEYIRQGCNVVVNHLGLEKDAGHLASMIEEAQKLKQSDPRAGDIIHVQGDITDPKAGESLVAKAVDKWGRLDVLVNNAGICDFIPFFDTEPATVSRHVEVNYCGSFYVSQAAAKQMAAQSPKGGSIIFLSSVTALTGARNLAHYGPTKAGVLNLAQNLAHVLGPDQIRCNALLPGTVWTQLDDHILKDAQKRAFMESKASLGRVAMPKDLAGPAVFLASDMSSYMTGSQLLVDGGFFVNAI